jgi:hypothetical protein
MQCSGGTCKALGDAAASATGFYALHTKGMSLSARKNSRDRACAHKVEQVHAMTGSKDSGSSKSDDVAIGISRNGERADSWVIYAEEPGFLQEDAVSGSFFVEGAGERAREEGEDTAGQGALAAEGGLVVQADLNLAAERRCSRQSKCSLLAIVLRRRHEFQKRALVMNGSNTAIFRYCCTILGSSA